MGMQVERAGIPQAGSQSSVGRRCGAVGEAESAF